MAVFVALIIVITMAIIISVLWVKGIHNMIDLPEEEIEKMRDEF